MNARTITVNKENWSGESITVKVEADGYFKVYDSAFVIEFKEFRASHVSRFEGFEVFSLDPKGRKEVDDDCNDLPPIVIGARLDDDSDWYAHMGIENEYAREDADPVAAAVKVLCNIL